MCSKYSLTLWFNIQLITGDLPHTSRIPIRTFTMQLTTYILATAMALSSGAFAIDIDVCVHIAMKMSLFWSHTLAHPSQIAYTSDGVGHTQTVQTDLQVPLDYPYVLRNWIENAVTPFQDQAKLMTNKTLIEAISPHFRLIRPAT